MKQKTFNGLGKCLLLNADYSPIGICSVEHAFCLLYTDKVELVVSDERPLHSVNGLYSRPSVVRVREYVKLPYKKVPWSKRNVLRRDHYICQYCGRGVESKLTVDHVMPASRGGSNDWTNVVAACKHCNNKKDNRTPEECGMKLRGKPSKPNRITFLKSMSKEIDTKWEPYLFS